MPKETQAVPADAVTRSWVEEMPPGWQPYLRLARLDRPIGTWLLFWPCVFGLTVGAGAQQRGFLSAPRDWLLLVLFATGAIAMRGAGCTYNDIADCDIDASVARTRGRPIPSGAVTVRQAWIFAGAQCAAGLTVLLCLNRFSVGIGVFSILLVGAYPFMKRVTWWPQAWLGLTFNWGALLGFAAITGRITAIGLVLYAGCFFWTLGYDTIYALQDIEDDALAGVKSTARLFGRHARTWIVLFYLMACGFLAISAGFLFRTPLVGSFFIPLLVHFLWQARRLSLSKPGANLAVFRSNREAGALIGLALAAGSWMPAVKAALAQ